MNILSLFDGMSGGMIALKRAGIPVDNYYASEVDKYAMQVSQKNYPDIIHIGDVKNVSYRPSDILTWNIGTEQIQCEPTKIDILIGGSPCQGFSFAGKQLNFEDPRSKLFFEYVRILKESKPKYFLLENVRMKKEYQDVISEHLGVQPVMINSALVSAQNRVRLYWVGILQEDGTYKTADISQPEDRGIFLKDILEDEVDEKFNLSNIQIERYLEKGNTHPSGRGMNGKVYDSLGKTPTLTTNKGEGVKIIQYPRGKNSGGEKALNGKTPCMSANQWEHNNLLYVKEATKRGYTVISEGGCFDNTQPNSKTRRGRNMENKSNCMTAGSFDFRRYQKGSIRKLTPIECERLQTLSDNYTEGVSNSQRYKMAGNGWNIETIVHILNEMLGKSNDTKQKSKNILSP